MKRILCGSALAPCLATAVWMASLAPTSQHCAQAQQVVMPGRNVVYYNGYGQGYYGGYAPNYGGYAPGYGGAYIVVPNNVYSGYGNGPYGYDTGYVNPGYNGPFGGRTFGGSASRGARNAGYYYSGF